MTTPVTGTTATTTSTAPTVPDNSAQELSGNFQTFLTLLTTQLKNQDPTSPMDTNQFTQQLVEFSQVEQQINTNDNLKTLIGQGQNQTGSYAASYLGKSVTVTNGQAPLTKGSADWSYTLGTTAAASVLTVTDSSGKIVYSGVGETQSGAHDFAWNGQDNNGNTLADGTYKLTVSAQAADGTAVTTSVASTGVVSEVDMSGTAPALRVGPMTVALGDIAAVRN